VTLPNFLVIGAAKAGTTSLYNYLRSHPEIFMSSKKELQFFPEEFNWRLGVEWYQQHFAEAGDALAIGEASTTYTRYPYSKGVSRRIGELLPDVRLIYLIRNPVERMRSEYLQHIAHGWEDEPSMERALLENPFYLDISRYAMQIEQYLECFPRERLLVITSEDLRHRRDATMHRVFEFLGVAAAWVPPRLDQEFNVTRRAPRVIQGRIRGLRGVRVVSSAIPLSVKRFAIRATSRKIEPSDRTISEGLRGKLESRLRDDVRRLRPYMSGEFDGWGIA